MKKLFKISIGVIAGLLLFTTGAFAANQGWLNFTGDEQVQQSQSNVNEIMEILRNVHKGKLDAEQALEELKKLDPMKLQKELQRANQIVEQLKAETDKALEEARSYE